MTATERERWREVTPAEPCEICGKGDWCRRSPGGTKIACRRESRGAVKTKRYADGSEAYLHVLRDDGPAASNGRPKTKRQRPAGAVTATAADAPILQDTPRPSGDDQDAVAKRDQGYRRLLALLPLSPEHRDSLRQRGLSDAEIDAAGYRTLPTNGRASIAKTLMAELGQDFTATPGLVIRDGHPRIAAPSGLLVPVRNLAGEVIAVKVRVDNPTSGGKYLYLSSAKDGGPGPGSPAHVPLGVRGPVDVARITEGEIKANVATLLCGVPTVSFPGVASWRVVLPALQALGVTTVKVAFDADAGENPNVARPLRECVGELRARGYAVELERWVGYKGIDDLLAAGGTPEVYSGDDALRVADEIAVTAGCHHDSCGWTWADLRQRYEPKDTRPVNLDGITKQAGGLPKPTATPKPARLVQAYQPFPVDALPGPLDAFVNAAARAMNCDPSFLALPLLAALAAAIGSTRRVVLKRGWSEPAILWAAIVGESGTTKTPAFKAVMRPVRDLQGKALQAHAEEMKRYETALAHYEKDLAKWKRAKSDSDPPEKPEQPQAVRYIVSDTTVEALAPLLLANHRGLLLARDELAGWLGSFDRYAGGKGGGADSAHWLSVHNGDALIVDRKTGPTKTLFVPHAYVSVCGGIQPAILNRALGLEHRESGLAARLLLTCPPRRPKCWTDADIDPAAEAELARLLARMYELQPVTDQDGQPGPDYIGLAGDAKRLFVEFYDAHGQEAVDLTGELAAAWSKLEAYAARLALIVHYARWAADDASLCRHNQVDSDSMRRAVVLTEWFKAEALRVYGVLSETDDQRETRQLVEWVRGKGGAVTARDLQQGPRQYRGSVEAAETALQELVKAGYGTWQDLPTTDKGGRPGRVFRLGNSGNGYTTPTNPDENRGSVAVASVAGAEMQDCDWGEV